MEEKRKPAEPAVLEGGEAVWESLGHGERTNSTNAEDRAKTGMKERGDERRRRGERNDPGEREERRG